VIRCAFGLEGSDIKFDDIGYSFRGCSLRKRKSRA
jgi:hypothetical protein